MFVSCVAEREPAGPGKGSCPPAPAEIFGIAALWRAYRACRRGKRNTRDTQRYEARLLDRLVSTRDALASFDWRPSRTLAFVVSHPKLREIHAATFSDRVAHHLLVDRLNRIYEPVFIHDSYANRLGKGTHAAVERLQGFMRAAVGAALAANGRPSFAGKPASTGAGPFALQLDIANFFNSIHRPTLFRLLQRRLLRAVRRQGLDKDEARALQSHCRALLAADPTANVRRQGPPATFEQIPPHKRLGALGPAVGLPVGNLTSQFFANVYLNELDQFVKHTLKARWYVRYVDDFVLLHADPAVLIEWRQRIVEFLDERLGLRLKAATQTTVGAGLPAKDAGFRGAADSRPRPLLPSPVPDSRPRPLPPIARLPEPQAIAGGVDFLGYVIRPSHCVLRRRAIRHFHARLAAFQRAHARANALRLLPAARDRLRAQVASFLGHCRHASAERVWQATLERFPWLNSVFEAPENALRERTLRPAWTAASVSGLAGQYRALSRRAPGARLLMQVGNRWLLPVSCNPRFAGKPAPTHPGSGFAAKAAPTKPGFIHPASCGSGLARDNGSSASPPPIAAKAAPTRNYAGLGPCLEFRASDLAGVRRRLKRAGQAHVLAAQTGHFKTGFKRREVALIWLPPGASSFLSTVSPSHPSSSSCRGRP